MFVEPSYKNTDEYKAFWHNLADGKFEAGEFKRLGKGGKEVWIQASYNPILDKNGKAYKVVKFASDITDKKLEFADFSGQVSAISRSQAVIEFDLDGVILNANDAFLSVMGYSRDEIVGKHHRMFVNGDYSKSSEYSTHWERLRKGEFIGGYFERVAKNGDPVWIQASYNPLFDLEGQPYKVVKFASDVAARMRHVALADPLCASSATRLISCAEPRSITAYVSVSADVRHLTVGCSSWRFVTGSVATSDPAVIVPASFFCTGLCPKVKAVARRSSFITGPSLPFVTSTAPCAFRR